MTGLALDAPAKLNLSLAVVGRRADGYHELESVMVLLELSDRLLLLPGSSGLRVEGSCGADVPLEPEDNLAWRGLVRGAGARPELACLALEKRVPAAAGLGGGSSDAAAGWRLGRRWTNAPEPASRGTIAELATLGADVPFFASLAPAAAVAGIGERVAPLAPPDPPLHVLLVHPPFGLSTAAVFAELRPSDWSRETPAGGLAAGRNDLLAPARRLRPELADLARLALAAGAEPHLTGSGPTLFALADDRERLRSVAARLARAGLATTLTRTRREAASIESIAEEEP